MTQRQKRLRVVADGGHCKNVKIFDDEGRDISHLFSAVEIRADVRAASPTVSATLTAPVVHADATGVMLDDTRLGDEFRRFVPRARARSFVERHAVDFAVGAAVGTVVVEFAAYLISSLV